MTHSRRRTPSAARAPQIRNVTLLAHFDTHIYKELSLFPAAPPPLRKKGPPAPHLTPSSPRPRGEDTDGGSLPHPVEGPQHRGTRRRPQLRNVPKCPTLTHIIYIRGSSPSSPVPRRTGVGAGFKPALPCPPHLPLYARRAPRAAPLPLPPSSGEDTDGGLPPPLPQL